ncbi:MAG: hypothetical protein OXM58_14540 [Rhodospirillaceae bacterium]|nr:hypothetical protein [Rhodospirillaceae bacterium]MDE0618987.1 hypothetical protein [Rhodospirillaceae bacterium]
MMQKLGKFDDLDRDRVVKEIEERCRVALEKAGRRPKWLRDDSGRNWWVLGGQANWHGIPEEMIQNERRAQVEGVLVIADRKRASIDVFKGPLGPLVSASDGFRRPSGDYSFNVKICGDRMWIKEAPNAVLHRLDTIPYSAEDKERDRKLNEFQKLISGMTPEQFKQLREDFGG